MTAWIKNSFKRQIIFVLFALIAFISALILIRLYYSEKHNLTLILESQAVQTVDTLAIAIKNNVRYSNYMELSDSITHIFNKNRELALAEGNLFQITDISVVDKANRILAHTNPKEHPLLLVDAKAKAYEKEFQQTVEPHTQFLWDKEATHLLLKRPIFFGLEEIGTIYVNVNAIRLLESESILLYNILILAGLLSVLLVLFVLFLGRWIEKPLNLLIQELEKIGSGTIAFPPLMKRRDEFATLASSLVEADKRIHMQKEELLEIHRNLENRVHLEVDNNRQKDYMMIQQARHAQMGEMISMIAHQWRQPLASISAATVSLQMNIIQNNYQADEFFERINKISEYAQHLSVTIDDFREYFKPNKHPMRFKVSKSIHNAIKLSESLFHNRGIEVDVKIKSERQINSFENELVQVIINLLKNAVDAFEEKNIDHPTIQVSLHEIGEDKIQILIDDNAGGIEQSVMEKIFEPYFSTKSKNGTGLGLYMSKSIIEEHCQGRLTVSNKNQGASFSIELESHPNEQ